MHATKGFTAIKSLFALNNKKAHTDGIFDCCKVFKMLSVFLFLIPVLVCDHSQKTESVRGHYDHLSET